MMHGGHMGSEIYHASRAAEHFVPESKPHVKLCFQMLSGLGMVGIGAIMTGNAAKQLLKGMNAVERVERSAEKVERHAANVERQAENVEREAERRADRAARRAKNHPSR